MFVSYKNGNYHVLLNLEDGTKIRYNNENNLKPSRPESLDVKITNQCQHKCAFCHENSTLNGKVASLNAMKNFVDTIPAYTEIAVGGGNLMLSYNHTEVFLKMLKEAKAIPSITVRQEDFIKNIKLLSSWKEQGLIYGIGVSLSDSYDLDLITCLKVCPTAVLHVIAGIMDEDDYNNLKGNNLKMLILGYKTIRRGKTYIKNHMREVVTNQTMLVDHFNDFKIDFDIVAFDNLALEQLDVQNKMTEEEWNDYYCGDDGEYTFYVDLVEEQFARSSTSLCRMDINNHSVKEMFDIIRENKILEEIYND